MFDFIYAEESILNHPRTRALINRFPPRSASPLRSLRRGLQPHGAELPPAKAPSRAHPRPQSRSARPRSPRRLRHRRRAQLLFLAPAQLPLRLPLLLRSKGPCTARRTWSSLSTTRTSSRTFAAHIAADAPRCALFLFWLRLRQPRARGHYPLYSRLPPLLCRPPAGVL